VPCCQEEALNRRAVAPFPCSPVQKDRISISFGTIVEWSARSNTLGPSPKGTICSAASALEPGYAYMRDGKFGRLTFAVLPPTEQWIGKSRQDPAVDRRQPEIFDDHASNSHNHAPSRYR
jgi:hypothetical protein